ncbi:MAG: PAS domain S-box protein [Sneathiellaceae bacterium]
MLTWSMRTKYVVFACSIAVFAAILLGGFNYYWVRQLTLERAYDGLSDAARLIAPQVKSSYERKRNDAVAISRMPPFQGLIRSMYNVGVDPLDGSTTEHWRERLQITFGSILRVRPEYVQMRFITVLDEGRELVRTDRKDGRIVDTPLDGLQVKGDRPYIAAATAMPATTVYYSRVTPNIDFDAIDFDLQVLRVVSGVRDDAGNLFGFMVINADYSELVQQMLARIETRGEIYVVNSNGSYIKRAADGTVSPLIHAGDISHRLPSLDPGTMIGDGREGISRDGGMLVSHARVDFASAEGPGSSATIILALPAEEVLADSTETQRQVLALSAGLVVLAFLLAFVVANWLTRPMHRAVTAIKTFRPDGGVLDLPVKRQDEIGALSRAFAGLVASLQASQRTESETLARLQAIMDNSIDGLITTDEDGTVLHYNTGAMAIFGHAPEEVIGRDFRMLMPQPERAERNGLLERFRNEDEAGLVASAREVIGLTADGRPVPLELSIGEVRFGDGRLYSGILRDITERKEMQWRLEEQAQRLRQSNQDLEDFAYIASHDLKEPLRAISNHVQFLKEDCGDAIDEGSQKRIERIRLLCQKADRLVADLLHFSRLGRAELAVETVDMEQLVAETGDNLADTLDERQAEIRLATPLPPVNGDRTRLGSLLHNLIVNGIKYNDSPAPSIEVGFEPEDRVPGGTASGRGAYFVRDNGIGIAEEFKDAIFKIFKRLNSEKSYGAGTGAGLSFARKIVERHGGRLWFQSTPGQGTTFYFDLPGKETSDER